MKHIFAIALVASTASCQPVAADQYVSLILGGKHLGLGDGPGDGWVEGTQNLGLGYSRDIGDNGWRVGFAVVSKNSYGDPTAYFVASKEWQVADTNYGDLFLGVGGGFTYGYDPDDLPHWDLPVAPAFGAHARYDPFKNGGGLTITGTPMGLDKGVLTARITVPIGD